MEQIWLQLPSVITGVVEPTVTDPDVETVANTLGAVTVIVPSATTSAVVTLSANEKIFAAPATPLSVNVAVAVPLDWIVGCAAEIAPWALEKLTATPSRAVRNPAPIVIPALFLKKLAVTVVEFSPDPPHKLVALPAQVSSIHVPADKAPAPPLPTIPACGSMALTGETFLPHQLSVMSTSPLLLFDATSGNVPVLP
jgi:hypothetical protein